jgi:hypothetical protein
MSDLSKSTLPVAVGPATNGPAIAKSVLYVAFTNEAVTPARKRVQGRIRYVGP